RLKTQASRQALERAYLEIKAVYGDSANKSRGKGEPGHGKSSSLTKICPKCGREYNPETKFCEEDGTKLIEIWKCRHCGEDLTKAQGYSAIKVCTSCGKSLDAMQQKSINSTKRVTKNPLKRICTNEKCGASYENNAKFCGKCGSPIVSMQCSCGEIFRQKEDGSFDKHCPVCGKPNPVEKMKITSKIGEIIELGSWRYEADGTKRPIKWQVMEIGEDGTAVLLSCYAIDNHAYHSKRVDITWAESDIRAWLNGEFYENAFSNEEKRRIIPVRLKNNDNKGEFTQEYVDYLKRWGIDGSSYLGQEWHTKGGSDTTDKVWLLSLDDMKKYSHIFKKDKDRQLKPTPNMCTRHEYGQGKYFQKNNCVGNAWWWLRSPGPNQNLAAAVYDDGFVYDALGAYVGGVRGGVRAALKINLKNL
ncbi:MAG: zinc ribbon domain-containing protein, partial [Elusimicrobiales bacterium]|nr:zinc ribbon domain-containing protein [Elusimicrobiales bacterium]